MPEHDRQHSTTSTAAEPPAEAQIVARGGAAQMLLGLQRTAGNAAVNALLQRRRRIQRTPLIESDYASLAELRKVITIKQTPAYLNWGGANEVPAQVEVSVADFEDSNVLSMGTVGQAELTAASQGDWKAQAALVAQHPEVGWHKGDLEGIRRISYVDRNLSHSAIGRISNLMAANIKHRPDRPRGTRTQTDEAVKNMFLHVFGQAIITTLWGRAAADLSGDIHERDQPALIVGGKLTSVTERQAIDNYCDLINNIHGQAWGELLSASLGVDDDTVWTPALAARYANDLQSLVAGSMGWTMEPIKPYNAEIVKFSSMLNEVMHGTEPPAPKVAPGTPP